MLGVVIFDGLRKAEGRMSCQESLVSHSILLFSCVFTTPSFRLSPLNTYVPEGGREGEKRKVRRADEGIDNVSNTCSAAAGGEHRGGAARSTCRAELSPPSSARLYTRCLADQYLPIILPVALRRRPRTTDNVTLNPQPSRPMSVGHTQWTTLCGILINCRYSDNTEKSDVAAGGRSFF